MLSLGKTFSCKYSARIRRLKVLDRYTTITECLSTTAANSQVMVVQLDTKLEEKLSADELKVNKFFRKILIN